MILVDDLRWYPARRPNRRRGSERWAHMVSDANLAELHEMATLRDHYDVRPRQHAKALWYGAEQVERRDLVRRMVGRRHGG